MIPDHVEHPSAWLDARAARIKANTRKGWLRDVPGAAEVEEFLLYGNSPGPFLADLRKRLEGTGRLTDAQIGMVLAIIRERKTEEENRDVPIPGGLYVGEVGKRQAMRLTIRKMFRNDGMYGVSYFYILACDAIPVIYRGTLHLGEVGDVVDVVATVKTHGQRKGHAQTIIARPKLQNKT